MCDCVVAWGPGGVGGRTQPALLSLSPAMCEAGHAGLGACSSPEFAQVSTPLLPSSDGRSSPPDLQAPLPCRAVPIAESLGLGHLGGRLSCEPCSHRPTCGGQRLCVAHGPRLSPAGLSSESWVHHEEHGHRAGHRALIGYFTLVLAITGEASGSAACRVSPLLSLPAVQGTLRLAAALSCEVAPLLAGWLSLCTKRSWCNWPRRRTQCRAWPGSLRPMTSRPWAAAAVSSLEGRRALAAHSTVQSGPVSVLSGRTW